MKNEMDIYDFPRRLESALKRIQESRISERNKSLILEFRDYCSLEGLSLPRIIRYIFVLKDWAKLLIVDFDKATKEDIMRIVRIIQERDNYSAWTKKTYKVMLKCFYKWLKKTEDGHPDEVKWIKTRLKMNEQKLPSNGDLITEEEVKKLINVAYHPRDKAFISVLYESGARIGEIASLQLENVKFDEYGIILNVIGKTGARPIRIISSTPYLSTWIDNHPCKDNPKAALWVIIGTNSHHKPIKYGTIRGMLKRLFEKANINKRFNSHTFRHSRATFLADHLTEFQMNHIVCV